MFCMKKKQKINQELEELEVIGGQSESKAIKALDEFSKQQEKLQKEKDAKLLDQLEHSKKKKITYEQKLLEVFHTMLLDVEIPKDYDWGIWFDGTGIRLTLKDRQKKLHTRAFIPSHNPEQDLKACYIYTYWLDDTIEQLDVIKTDSLWTPPKN